MNYQDCNDYRESGRMAVNTCPCGKPIKVSMNASAFYKLYCQSCVDQAKEFWRQEYARAIKEQGNLDEFVIALREHGGKITVFRKNRSGLFGALEALIPSPGPPPWYARFSNILHAFVAHEISHPEIEEERVAVPSRSYHKSALPWGEVGHSSLILRVKSH
jgi:hypothetical protein